MSEQDVSKEQRILVVMRKVLASVIKDTTPPRGMRHPLSDTTIEEVRHCLSLIVARERELGEAQGEQVSQKPYFVDEAPTGKVVPLRDLTKREKKD